jgi:hypothetical protein
MVIPGGGPFGLLVSGYSFEQDQAIFLRCQSAERIKRSDTLGELDHCTARSAEINSADHLSLISIVPR